TYFDVKSKQFKTLKTKAISLNVEPRDEAQQTQTPEPKQKTKEKKHPKKAEIYELEGYSQSDEPYQGIPFLAFVLLMTLPYAWMAAKKLRRWWENKNSGSLLLISTMQKINTCEKNNDASQLYDIITTFMTQHFGKSQAKHISEEWIFQQLTLIGIKPGKIESFIDFLSKCASKKFAKTTKGTYLTYQSQFQQARQWLEIITKEQNK
ncbi:hypothetical protein KAU11_02260, partial [Candidatus Babeliales bacterium]|nr:hypothetical protein [Candidatus Babeliales bacterium]